MEPLAVLGIILGAFAIICLMFALGVFLSNLPYFMDLIRHKHLLYYISLFKKYPSEFEGPQCVYRVNDYTIILEKPSYSAKESFKITVKSPVKGSRQVIINEDDVSSKRIARRFVELYEEAHSKQREVKERNIRIQQQKMAEAIKQNKNYLFLSSEATLQMSFNEMYKSHQGTLIVMSQEEYAKYLLTVS